MNVQPPVIGEAFGPVARVAVPRLSETPIHCEVHQLIAKNWRVSATLLAAPAPRRETPRHTINFINLAAIIGANPPNRRRGQWGRRGTGWPLPFSAILG